MSLGKKLLLSTVIGLTGLATVQADIKISRMDGNSMIPAATTQKADASGIYIV